MAEGGYCFSGRGWEVVCYLHLEVRSSSIILNSVDQKRRPREKNKRHARIKKKYASVIPGTVVRYLAPR